MWLGTDPNKLAPENKDISVQSILAHKNLQNQTAKTGTHQTSVWNWNRLAGRHKRDFNTDQCKMWCWCCLCIYMLKLLLMLILVVGRWSFSITILLLLLLLILCCFSEFISLSYFIERASGPHCMQQSITSFSIPTQFCSTTSHSVL